MKIRIPKEQIEAFAQRRRESNDRTERRLGRAIPEIREATEMVVSAIREEFLEPAA